MSTPIAATGPVGAAQQVGQRHGRGGVGRQQVQSPLVGGARGGGQFPRSSSRPPSSNQTRTSEGSSCSAALKAASAAERSPSREETWACRWKRSGRPGARTWASANAVQRAERVTHRQPDPCPGHQDFDVAPDAVGQLVGKRRRVAGPPEREERADLAQGRVGIVGRGRPGLAVALEGFAIEAALGEDVAQEHRGRAARRASAAGPAQLRHGQVEQPLRDVVAGQVQRVARRGRLDTCRRGRGELLEQLIEHRRVEAELARQVLARALGRELRGDGDGGILVLQIDREGELLGHVERFELQRAPGLPKRGVEVAELAQHEAQVVVGRREVGVRVHGAPESIARVFEAPELHEHEPHAVPGHGAALLFGERLLVLGERRAELAPLEVQQPQVEAGREERPAAAERFPEGPDRGFGARTRAPGPRRGCSRRADSRGPPPPPARRMRPPPPAGPPGGGTPRARSTAWGCRGTPAPAPRTAPAPRPARGGAGAPRPSPGG